MDNAQGQQRQGREDELGALWRKQSKNGEDYFTGSIQVDGQKVEIVVFANRYKKSDKQPDFRILRSRDRGARSDEHREPPRAYGRTEAADAVNDDSIPF